jgi:hypothetical protein
MRVLVPCNPMEYLNQEYGDLKNWIIPKSKGYKWSNVEKKSSFWSEKEWLYAVKHFHSTGKLNYLSTLNFINTGFKFNLTSLPVDVLDRYQ